MCLPFVFTSTRSTNVGGFLYLERSEGSDGHKHGKVHKTDSSIIPVGALCSGTGLLGIIGCISAA